MAERPSSSAWMDEQAAEYADLVGSFVESVHDDETDEMIEYQLIWEGGDLGVALTPMENDSVGVMVSRVTGKGFPFGIKNVGPGDVLLSINVRDMTRLSLDQVVSYLQECDLPATLRFKKVSPDMDRMTGPAQPQLPPAQPRMSHIVVTSGDTPTSPLGSQRPPSLRGSVASNGSSNRKSQKASVGSIEWLQQQQAQAQARGGRGVSNASSARPSLLQQQGGRMSVHSQGFGRPSEMSQPNQRPSDGPLFSPPKAPAQAPVPVPAPAPVVPRQSSVSPPKPQQRQQSATPLSVPAARASQSNKPTPTPKPVAAPVVAAAVVTAPAPAPAPLPASPPPAVVAAAAAPPPPRRASPPPPPPPVQSSPAPAPVVVAAVQAPKPAPVSPRPAAKAPPPTPPPATAVAVIAPHVVERMSSDSYRSSDGGESWKSSEEDIDEARERHHRGDLPVAPPLSEKQNPLARGESLEDDQEPRGKAQSVAMLGDYSIQTNGIPMLPEESIMGVIASIDGVPQQAHHDAMVIESDDDDISPVGHAVQPTPMDDTTATMRGSTRTLSPAGSSSSLKQQQQQQQPRESMVRLTMDGNTEPMMKTQPIGALHELCAKGNLRSTMQHLQVHGADALIQREANHGQTCLHLAVKSGNLQLVKHLLEQYEPLEELINVEDDKGNTSLHFAATKTPGMVHLLLENGASANVKNARKLTPLIISVITSKDDAIIIPRMLLKYGANPNDMHDSHTVIHTAIGTRKLQIAGALVHAGAKMDVEDADGKNIYEKIDKKSIRFLISHIYFPPTYITEKERTDCMVCHKKIKFGHRKNNCTHCGRLCCSDCSGVHVEMHTFPMGFPGRIRKGAACHDLKKVCKTCFGVFKEREGNATPQKEENRFLNRVIGIEWDEVNPNKLQSHRSAGRRGEKDY